jgi:hypothetical protein
MVSIKALVVGFSLFVCLGRKSSAQNVRRRFDDEQQESSIGILRGTPSSASKYTVSLSNVFPSLRETVEMARLSSLIYGYHLAVDDDMVCPAINSNMPDLHCHWYSHNGNSSESDTQVMIVSSKTYVAVVFAGTDDLQSSLVDAHILEAPFGDENHTLIEPLVRVHAGFNKAVFYEGLFDVVSQKLTDIYANNTVKKKLYTTGHSLGAANSVLTALALTAYRCEYLPQTITTINFGCPRIGNSFYKDFIHLNPAVRRLSIWRVVLGWDLVPRLPNFYYHAGHTIQLYESVKNDSWSSHWWTTNTTIPVAYYQHYGDAELGFEGVPFGWYAEPFVWLPGALSSHRMSKYYAAMLDLKADDWVKEFVKHDNNTTPLDDDEWRNPDDLLPSVKQE